MDAVTTKTQTEVTLAGSSPVKSLLRAQNDVDAVSAWLAQYVTSPNTFNTYRREAERFIHWCRERHLQLKELAHEDVAAFSAFLLAPSADWVADRRRRRDDKEWKPMIGGLSLASHRMAMIVVRRMLAWLAMSDYLPRNPAALIRIAKMSNDDEITRYLPIEAITLIDDAIRELPDKTKPQILIKARAQFLFSLYYETGIRLSEGVTASMSDMTRDAKGYWWIYVMGKGATKKKPLPVSARLLADFKAYRQAFGLPALPAPGDSTALILQLRKRGDRIKKQAVAIALTSILKSAADLASSRSLPEIEAALRYATAHWLRHSCLSHLLDDGNDLKIVQDIGRHKSIATTGRYLHKRADALHVAVTRRSSSRH